MLAVATVAGCTPATVFNSVPPLRQNPAFQPPPVQFGIAQTAADFAAAMPGTTLLAASPGICARGPAAVVHLAVPERVLFQTASDQPAAAASALLDFVTQTIRRDAPAAEVTVLGHTDAVGSDAYNVDLSRRRAETVMRALVARGMPHGQLSTVAVGKRQPIADNDTPEGRAQNRRVEFLVSPCLAANLEVVRRVATNPAYVPIDDAGAALNVPLDVQRLAPTTGGYGLSTVGTIALNQPALAPGAAEPRTVTPETLQPETLQPDTPADAATPATMAPEGSPGLASPGLASPGAVPVEAVLPDAQPASRQPTASQPSHPLPPARSTLPLPTPAYVPRMLAPDAAPRSLGPAISY